MIKPIHITDHALIRYMERVRGFNLDEIRAEIADAVRPAMELGAVTHRIEGYTFSINPQVRSVITVLAPGMRASNAKSRRKAIARA